MKRTSVARFAAACAFCWGGGAFAATLYWDAADSSAAADGGAGIWSDSSSLLNWDDAATNGSSVAWAAGSSAVFGGAPGTVTLGAGITAGTVTLDAAGYEFATAGYDLALGALAGSGAFAKSGAGTLTINAQGPGYTGKITVGGGLLKLATGWNVLGEYNTSFDKVTVAPGATLDVAGAYDTRYGITLAGAGTAGQGALINSGADTGSGHIQFPNIALSADAAIGGSGTFYMIAPSHGPNALALNGHTLTKLGPNTFYLDNTWVGEGSVHVEAGALGLIKASAATNTAFTLANAAGAALALNSFGLVVGSLAGGGAAGGNVSLGSAQLIVGMLGTSTEYAGSISGTGSLVKNGGGTFTLSGASAYTGATTVNAGRLDVDGSLTSAITVGSSARLGGTGSTTGALTMNGGTLMLDGGATTAGLTVAGAAFSSPIKVRFDQGAVAGNVYDVLRYGGGAVVNPENLTVPFRGTLTNDTASQKFTFTATGDGNVTRTWNTLSGTWDQGVSTNWAEGDQMFYTGDEVVFGNISTDAVVTLSGTLYPSSVTVSPATNQYAFAGGGAIAGDIGLTKGGGGTLLLANQNQYSGATLVNGGTLKVGNKTAFGPQRAGAPAEQVVVSPGGTLDFNGIVDAVYGYTIAGEGAGGAGALVNTGSAIGTGNAQCTRIRLAADASIGGAANWALLTWSYGPTSLELDGHTLTKTGNNTIYLCKTTISAGTVRIASGALSQHSAGIVDGTRTLFALENAAGATLSLNNISTTLGALTGGGASGGVVALGTASLTVGTLNTSNTFSGAFSGSGSLIKAGTNTLAVAGNSSGFTGPVVVNGGVLRLGASGPASVPPGNVLGAANYSTNKVTVASGATLDLAGFDNTSYGLTLAGAGTAGQGALINSGASTSVNHIQTPFIALSADASVGGSGNFYMIAGGYSANALTLNGHTLTKVGNNTFSLVSTTVSSGAVTIAEGTLAQDTHGTPSDGSAALFALANAPGATLALNNRNFSVGALAGGGPAGGSVSLGSGRLTVGALSTNAVYGGVVSGSGGLVKVGGGVQTLAGENTYSGATAVSNGTLLVNGRHLAGSGYAVSGGAALGGTGTVSVASGGGIVLQGGAALAPGAEALAGGTLTLSTLSMAAADALRVDHPGDRVVVTGALSLEDTPVTISDIGLFDRRAVYPLLTCTGSIAGALKKSVGAPPWLVSRRGNTFYLLFNTGTLVTLL